jgi:hypothetical protein
MFLATVTNESKMYRLNLGAFHAERDAELALASHACKSGHEVFEDGTTVEGFVYCVEENEHKPIVTRKKFCLLSYQASMNRLFVEVTNRREQKVKSKVISVTMSENGTVTAWTMVSPVEVTNAKQFIVRKYLTPTTHANWSFENGTSRQIRRGSNQFPRLAKNDGQGQTVYGRVRRNGIGRRHHPGRLRPYG